MVSGVSALPEVLLMKRLMMLLMQQKRGEGYDVALLLISTLYQLYDMKIALLWDILIFRRYFLRIMLINANMPLMILYSNVECI